MWQYTASSTRLQIEYFDLTFFSLGFVFVEAAKF